MLLMLLSFRDWLASVLAVGNGVPALGLTTDAESGHLGEGPETGDERALVGFAVHGYLLQIVLVVWIDSELVAGALPSKACAYHDYSLEWSSSGRIASVCGPMNSPVCVVKPPRSTTHGVV